MIYLPQPVPQVLLASGVLLLVIAVVYLSRANGALEDPLTRAGTNRGQRAKILNLLYKEELPVEGPERKLAIERAEYEVVAGPALLTWIPMLCGSVVLMLFGAYLLEPVALTSFVLQCVVIALGVFTTLKARRSIRSCRNVITSLHVAPSGAGASAGDEADS